MIHIALHVDHRLVGPSGDFAHVGVALARYQVVPDGDAVAVARQDDAGVLGAFAVRHLRGRRLDEMRMAAKLRDPGFKRIARARGFIEEHQENGLVRQIAMGNAVFEHALQLRRQLQRHLEFVFAPILGGNVIFAFQCSDHLLLLSFG